MGRIQITNLPKCLKIFRDILGYSTNFSKYSTRKELINKEKINIVYGRRMVIEKNRKYIMAKSMYKPSIIWKGNFGGLIKHDN